MRSLLERAWSGACPLILSCVANLRPTACIPGVQGFMDFLLHGPAVEDSGLQRLGRGAAWHYQCQWAPSAAQGVQESVRSGMAERRAAGERDGAIAVATHPSSSISNFEDVGLMGQLHLLRTGFISETRRFTSSVIEHVSIWCVCIACKVLLASRGCVAEEVEAVPSPQTCGACSAGEG